MNKVKVINYSILIVLSSIVYFNWQRVNTNHFENRYYSEEDGYVWKSGYEPITIPNLTLDKYVWKNIDNWPNKIAIECSMTGRKYTYAELKSLSSKTAVGLSKKYGLSEGDVIAIVLRNLPEYPIIVLGAIEAGMIVTTINPLSTSEEISRQLISSSAKIAFGMPDTVDALVMAKQKPALSDLIIFLVKSGIGIEDIPDGMFDFTEVLQENPVESETVFASRNLDDTCLLPFSSGTSGLPKGVMLTHRNIVANCEMLKAKLPNEPFILPTTEEHQDVIPFALPFSHIYGLTSVLLSKLSEGCKIITIPKFQSDSFIDVLVKYKATVLFVVPPICQFLANNEKVQPNHLATVRNIMTAAAPVGTHEAKLILQKAPHIRIIQGYGLTEASPRLFLGQLGSKNYGSIGWPLPSTEVKIVEIDDKYFRGVDVNVEGELLARSASIMKGYLNNSEATKETILANGWLRTGDIASYDENGDFYIKDRLKELIKVKGFPVAPAELESLLRTHTKVSDAGVIGVRHERFGEVPKAFVVRKENYDVSEGELQQFVADKLSEFKQLRGGVEFVEEIPKNPSGKILRRLLKKNTV